ncbi:MAG: hypothetical protein U1D55_18670 [Phycisphaerae bacterium]
MSSSSQTRSSAAPRIIKLRDQPRLRHIYFIRGQMAYECPDYFESKTDVWILGDLDGYQYFCDALHSARRTRRNQHLTGVDPHSHSMRVVILPAARAPRVPARLKVIERVVFATVKPEMELVIYGNAAGYQLLAGNLTRMMRECADNPELHTHLDDDGVEPCLVKRSVSLDIRGPLRRWGQGAGECWERMVYSRQATYLPADVEDLTADILPYSEINPAASPFLALE